MTQPDRRRSRGGRSDPSPVKQAATELGLPVARRRRRARSSTTSPRRGAEAGVVVAFGQLLPTALLEALPARLRERALLAAAALARRRTRRTRAARGRRRDRRVPHADRSRARHRSGVRVRRVAIDAADTTGIAARRARARVGTRLLLRHLPNLAAATATPQVGEPTYADKLTIDEFRVDPHAHVGRARSHRARRRSRNRARGSAPAARAYKVFGPTTATAARSHALGVVGAAGIGTADGTLAAARDPTRGQAAHGVGRLAPRPPRRSRDRRVSATARPAASRSTRSSGSRTARSRTSSCRSCSRRSRLAPRDRGLVTELVYGTVRMQRALDFQLAKVSKQAIDDLEPEVRAAIRLGAYQLLLGIPSHAAVGETVEVVAVPSARLRERRAARARAHRPAVVVAGRTRDRRHRRAHVASRLDRAPARRHVRNGRRDRDAGPGRRGRARDAAPEPDARHRERRRAGAARRGRRRHPRRARPRRVGVARRRRHRRARARTRGPGHAPGPGQPGRRRDPRPAAGGARARSRRRAGREDGRDRGTDARRRARRRGGRQRRVACASSRAARDRLALRAIAPVVADGRHPTRPRGIASIVCCSTRRAAASACCGAVRTRGGGSDRATSASSPSCSAS